MGKYTLLIVLAAVLGGSLLTSNLRSSLRASETVHSEGQEAVLAREIARSAQSLALARMVGTGGFQDPGFGGASEFEGGEFEVRLAPGWTPEQATLVVEGRYGGAVHEVQSTYRYDPMDAPGPLWLDVPYATGTSMDANIDGGGRPVYFDRRKHDELRLGSFLPLSGLTDALAANSLLQAITGSGTGFQIPEANAWAGGLLEDLNVNDTEGLYQATEAAFNVDRDTRLAGDQTVTGDVTWGSAHAITIVEGDLAVEGRVRGSGALVVKGDLRVPSGGTVEWEGLLLVRSTDDVLTIDVDGALKVDGAMAVVHQAFPPGGHLDVSVYRKSTGITASAPWGNTSARPYPWTNDYRNPPFHQHVHGFDILPATAPRGSHVYFLEGGAAGRHGYETQFYDTIRSLGDELVYLEFGNDENHGFSRYTLDVAGRPGPMTGSIRTGFPEAFSAAGTPSRSSTFKASDLRRLDVDVRSLRALRQAFDGPECAEWPVCIGRDFDREDALGIRLMRASDGARLYESTLYWHMRTDEQATHAAEEQAWRDRIQAGEAFGTHLRLGRKVDLTYTRTPIVDLAPTLGFDGDQVTLVETASRQVDPSEAVDGAVQVCHVDAVGIERTTMVTPQSLDIHLSHGDVPGPCGASTVQICNKPGRDGLWSDRTVQTDQATGHHAHGCLIGTCAANGITDVK